MDRSFFEREKVVECTDCTADDGLPLASWLAMQGGLARVQGECLAAVTRVHRVLGKA